MATSNQPATSVTLKRSLRFRDLILFGIILIQPTAPLPVFGVLYEQSRGHVVTVILLAMVAMLLTSVSYGRMARANPHGGSFAGPTLIPSRGDREGAQKVHILECWEWLELSILLILMVGAGGRF